MNYVKSRAEQASCALGTQLVTKLVAGAHGGGLSWTWNRMTALTHGLLPIQ